MAQGQHKAKSTSQIMKAVKKQGGSKIQRGVRKAPKSQNLQKEKAMQKKLSARNIQNTEAQMALKAGSTGKLTIMKPIADLAKKEAEKKKEKK